MRYFLFYIFCFVILCFSQHAGAAENININQDNLNELIKTLESETARKDFLQNLKTLKETSGDEQAPTEEAVETFSAKLGLSGLTKAFLKRYNDFLSRNNLKSSIIGQILLTFGAFFIFAFIQFVIRKSGVAFRDRLNKMRDHYALSHDRFRYYVRGLRYIGYTLSIILLLYTVTHIWYFTFLDFIVSENAVAFYSHLFTILIVSLIAISVWEVTNIGIEYGLHKSSDEGANRLRTLLPIIKNVVFVAFALLFTLIILSELGINIVPLLAGAGVLGIAIGFGAQSMVKDFLTGFTIILEDLVQVGDVAKVGDKIGLVEKITIRKIQLRDLSGIVYTVPHSEINIIENWTKDFSFYLMDIGVAYRENTDEVIEYLKEIDEDLRSDDHYKRLILDAIEILGVDKFADSAVIIKARIKTKPIKQWEVGREFNRRMKIKFDEKGVEIPFPHQTLYFGQDKDGSAPPASIILNNATQDNKSSKS